MEYDPKLVDEIFDEVEKSDSVILFGHVNPDGDCLGSVYGMKEALKSYYPNKHIYAVGSHPKYIESLLEPSDVLDEETYKKSLGFVVDVSDPERIEDKNFSLCKKVVCIDHHILNGKEKFLTLRDTLAPSASFVLTKCLLMRYGKIPASSANFFYLGLVTDTGRFQYDSEPETFEIAKKLVQLGADYRNLYSKLYVQSSASLRFRSYVYSNFKASGNVSYVLVPRSAYESLGMEQNQASNQVNLLSLLDGRPIWVQFTEQDDSSIRVEFRSDGHYNVQKAAVAFGGGGHFAASGCKLKSLDEAEKVVAYLNTLEKEN